LSNVHGGNSGVHRMSKFNRYKQQHHRAPKNDPQYKIGQKVLLTNGLTGLIVAVHPGSIRVVSLAGVQDYPKATISQVIA